MKIPTTLFALSSFLICSAAYADSFNVSYLSAGIQASSSSSYAESFTNAVPNSSGTYTTTFNGSNVTGTYSGNYNILNADQYGGANGTGKYIVTGSNNSSYALALSSSVNYFGMWFSALDPGNMLTFYNGNTQLYSFSSADFIKAVGACPGSAYCGNPNNGQDGNEQFAFINYYDTNGSFNKIVFTQSGTYGGEFESDNHTIGNIASTPSGIPLAVTPEPSTLAMLGTGVVGVVVAARRRFLTT